MDQMRSLFIRGVFGKCPRHFCTGQNCLPVGSFLFFEISIHFFPGENSRIGQSAVKIFCPRCKQIYNPKHYYDLDGAYFGPSFPAAFLMQFPNLCPPPPVQIPYKFPSNLKNPGNNEINKNLTKETC